MYNLTKFMSKMTTTPLCHIIKKIEKINKLSKCLFSTNKTFTSSLLNQSQNTKLIINSLLWKNYLLPKQFSTSLRLCGLLGPMKASEGSFNAGGCLTKQQADELALKLTTEERNLLLNALQEYQSKMVKDEYIVETVAPPTTKELVGLCVANSIPFIGFGFLDNFIMILAGDYIDITLGSYFCISTMAAAALGNTFSDVMGIGSAYYVERLANYIGYQPPKLTPIQLDMPTSRQFGNLGRVIGVTLGCLLGMLPLAFINTDTEKKHKEEGSQADL